MRQDSNVIAIVVALVAVVIAIGAALVSHGGTPKPGAVTGTTAYNSLGISQLKIASNCNDEFKYGTCNGSAINGINYGSCQVIGYSNTIAASTTGQVDCGTTGLVGGTLTGVSANDFIESHATTTISCTSQGCVSLVASAASTTNGYVTLVFANNTGATFTWTGAASTSIQYLDFH